MTKIIFYPFSFFITNDIKIIEPVYKNFIVIIKEVRRWARR